MFTLPTQPSISNPGITDIARSGVFLCNWLLCTLIIVNQTSNSSTSREIYNRAMVLYVDTMKNQFTIDDTRFAFIVKCAMKTSLLLVGFFIVNKSKYTYIINEPPETFEIVLSSLLFFPSFIMTMASNKFYVATSFILYLVNKNNKNIKEVDVGCQGIYEMRKISLYFGRLPKIAAARINFLAIIHSDLHQLFVDFNMVYAKYIVLILSFCFVNVVFEVRPTVTICSHAAQEF
jgi:hypothetical protein